MAEYGYRSGDYTTSSRMYPKTDAYNMNNSAAYGLVTDGDRGRTKPVICFPESCGTKPFVEQTEYKYSSSANRWGRPSSPVHDRDSQRAGEFFTKIQTEITQVTQPNSTMNWRQPPYSTGHNGSSGYGGYSDYSKNDSWNRPSGNTIRNDSFDEDDYYRRNNRAMEVMNTSGGWGSRPNSGGWSATSDSTLTQPTNNIGAAVETLKEAAMPTSSRQGGFTAPVSAGHSMDATRRYGNFKLISRPANSGGYY